MAKKRKAEEHAGGESGTGRWMLTYLDMVTLLFGVFVIMFAMSQVDKKKFDQAAESLRMGFQGGHTIFRGPLTGGQTVIENLSPLGSQKRHVYEMVRKYMKTEFQRDVISIQEAERGVIINFMSDIFFTSGDTNLSDEMKQTLRTLAPILKEEDYYIIIAGNTDEQPVRIGAERVREFSDNWELSALRAIRVLQYLEDLGVQPEKLSAQAFGRYRPIDRTITYERKDTPEFRSLNRRVDIIIETGRKFKKGTRAPVEGITE